MNRVLVTGGAGFIGSHICDSLVNLGVEVVCLDNLMSGSMENISHLLGSSLFQFIEGDIRSLETCLDAMDGCDAITHQAALGSVPRSVTDPISTNSHNVSGTLNIFHAANYSGVKRVVFASSSSAYGDDPNLPKVEGEIGEPLSPYAVSKRVGELYSRVFAELHGMEMVGLRYFNIYGPRQNPDGMYAAVIPKFIHKLLSGERPTIHGDGEQTRDFTYVSNSVNANLAALSTERKDVFGRVYNVACGSNISVNKLFLEIRKILSKENPEIGLIEPEYSESRPGDVPHSMADISLAKSYLEYIPEKTIEDGLLATVDSFLV